MVYERYIIRPYGAYFYTANSVGEIITISTKITDSNIVVTGLPPKSPQGTGVTFAKQLPPGEYNLIGWGLDYGGTVKMSLPPGRRLEFLVEKGRTIYIGRFDANRFLEVAYVWNNFNEDVRYIKRVAILKYEEIENKSSELKGWWLPDATGKRMLKTIRKSETDCDQCITEK